MQGPPTFLVLDQAGNLHAYYREDILKIDLASNRAEPPQQVFKLAERTLTISYYPIKFSDALPAPKPLVVPHSHEPQLLNA